VAYEDLLGGEDARGEDRQGAVLVAGRHHRARQRRAAFDDELLHELSAPPTGALEGASPDRAGRVAFEERNTHLASQVRARTAGTCKPRRTIPRRAPALLVGPGCKFRCSDSAPETALPSGFRRRWTARTHVRPASVRDRSYLTNTCSHHCGHRPLPSGRSMRWTWPARSSCSRTTT